MLGFSSEAIRSLIINEDVAQEQSGDARRRVPQLPGEIDQARPRFPIHRDRNNVGAIIFLGVVEHLSGVPDSPLGRAGGYLLFWGKLFLR